MKTSKEHVVLPSDISFRFSLGQERGEIVPDPEVWPIRGTVVVIPVQSYDDALETSRALRSRIPALPKTLGDLMRATRVMKAFLQLSDADKTLALLPRLTPRSAADIIPRDAEEDPEGFARRFKEAVLQAAGGRKLSLNEAAWLALECVRSGGETPASITIPELRRTLTGSGSWTSTAAIRRIVSGLEMRLVVVVRKDESGGGFQVEAHIISPPGWSREEIRQGVLAAIESLRKTILEEDGCGAVALENQSDVERNHPVGHD